MDHLKEQIDEAFAKERAEQEPKKYWYITGEGDICRDDIENTWGGEE